MKKLFVVLSMLALLLGPVWGEDSGNYVLEQGTVAITYGPEININEANCALMGVDSALLLNSRDIPCELTLLRFEGELILVFTIPDNDEKLLDALADLGREIHQRAFPQEHLKICTIDEIEEEVFLVYSSREDE